MIWGVVTAVFLSQFMLTLWIASYLQKRRKRIKTRINEIERKEWQETEKTVGKNNKANVRFLLTSYLWNLFSHIKWLKQLDERLQNELKNANILMKSKELIVMMFFSGLLGGFLGVILIGGSKGAWLAMVTWLLPMSWVNVKKNKRKNKLEAQLPEMINMTANSLKAGYSLLQAFELLSREMATPLSEEIQRLLQEIRLGVTTERALIHFNQRIDSKDLDLIITSMLIQRQIGGNLAEILDKIGDTIRERIKIQGEIRSLTAQGKMSMIIFMILPIGLAIFLTLFNTEYMMTLIINPIGWLMITVAVVGQIIGAIFIKKITQIEV